MSSRDRLLKVALELFSHKGFEAVSVRDIAEAAGVNLAAISYHFGGKAGLYRAALHEPLGRPRDDIERFDRPHFSLHQSLQGLYTAILQPFTLHDQAQQCIRLHLREMMDGSPAWSEQIQHDFLPVHRALARVLRRHLGLKRDDDDLMRLVFTLTGLANHLFLSQDVVRAMRPGLLASPAAVHRWRDGLVASAEALIHLEAQRRAAVTSPAHPQKCPP